MEIKIIPAKAISSVYQQMIKTIYHQDPHFKNNKQGLLDLVCHPKSAFYQNSKQHRVAVMQNQTILCLAVLIQHKAKPEVLSIAFFEALPNAPEAVTFLMTYAKKHGKTLKATKMTIGIDGHCNHGLGFSLMTKGYPSFGEGYTPTYYLDYFKDFEQHRYISYEDRVAHIALVVNKYIEKMAKREADYTLEVSDFRRKLTRQSLKTTQGFKQTMKRYTDLNNLLFKDHDYYFQREYEEDQELFQSMKPLLDNHNLIFIQKEGKDIGFILWYFDYNELVKPGYGAGVATFIKYRLLKKMPKKVKIVEIGVLPEYQGSPAILYLFREVMVRARQVNPGVEQLISSWISENNSPSRLVTSKFAKLEYRKYVTYERSI